MLDNLIEYPCIFISIFCLFQQSTAKIRIREAYHSSPLAAWLCWVFHLTILSLRYSKSENSVERMGLTAYRPQIKGSKFCKSAVLWLFSFWLVPHGANHKVCIPAIARPPMHSCSRSLALQLRGGFDKTALFEEFRKHATGGAAQGAENAGGSAEEAEKSEMFQKLFEMAGKIDKEKLMESMLNDGDAEEDFKNDDEKWEAIWNEANKHGIPIPRKAEDVPPISKKVAEKVGLQIYVEPMSDD